MFNKSSSFFPNFYLDRHIYISPNFLICFISFYWTWSLCILVYSVVKITRSSIISSLPLNNKSDSPFFTSSRYIFVTKLHIRILLTTQKLFIRFRVRAITLKNELDSVPLKSEPQSYRPELLSRRWITLTTLGVVRYARNRTWRNGPFNPFIIGRSIGVTE